MKTFSAKKEEIKPDWYLVNADGAVLGRLAVEIAHRLRGKHKPIYTPHVDTGDFIVVVNADKVRLTGAKMQQKKYYRYSGYPGGLKQKTAAEMIKKHPTRILYNAVRGMLPKNPLGRKMLKKLKVYAAGDHPHQSQKPQTLELKGN